MGFKVTKNKKGFTYKIANVMLPQKVKTNFCVIIKFIKHTVAVLTCSGLNVLHYKLHHHDNDYHNYQLQFDLTTDGLYIQRIINH